MGEVSFDVIFVTAHDQFALKAFKFSAVDYLRKPVIPGELMAAIQKIKEWRSRKGELVNKNIERPRQKLRSQSSLAEQTTIPITDGFHVLDVRKIIYCQASNNCTRFCPEDAPQILSSCTRKQYDDLLTGHGFFSIRKSFLINLSHVREYRKGEAGRHKRTTARGQTYVKPALDFSG